MDDAMTITTAMSAERNINITNTIKGLGNRLFRFIRQRVGSTEDAEDILQDVLYQFAGNKTPVEQASSWLFKVARNKITDSYRKQRLPLADDILPVAGNDEEGFNWREMFPSDDADPESAYLRNIFWEELQQALDELPAEQRQVFVQTEVEGLAFKDIAEATGELVPTLISRKRYAILHLRKRLKALRDELLNY
jgi:RNA polymerase sigma factor (sigma-70 family)